MNNPFYGIDDRAPDHLRGAALAIGNFDGVHAGHRALVAAAAARGKPCAVMTFEPHPRRFFQPDASPFRLTSARTKNRLLYEAGADHVFSYAFDAALAALDGQTFIDRILVQNLGVSHVVVGEDFAFGRGRSGSVDLLRQSGAFDVTVVPPVMMENGMPYASTAARAAIAAGDLDAAIAILGQAWEIDMPVIHGDKRGRLLGYPTANQAVGEYLRLPYGIYAVRVQIEGEKIWRNGVANFGIRPMFEIEQPIFETFIFDFNDNIYGKHMRVVPVRRLRGEQSFDSLDALVVQMKEDCIVAKAVLESHQHEKISDNW